MAKHLNPHFPDFRDAYPPTDYAPKRAIYPTPPAHRDPWSGNPVTDKVWSRNER